MKAWTALGLMALAPIATASGADSLRQTLDARYAAVTKAIQKRDITIVAAMLTPDYVAVSPSGRKLKRSDVLQQFQLQANAMGRVSWPRHIDSLTVTGTTATAVVSGHFTGYTLGKQSHKVELIATTRDTWVKTAGAWKLKASKLMTNKVLFDGKRTAQHP
jgi:ketosteroid isomerase-like protein